MTATPADVVTVLTAIGLSFAGMRWMIRTVVREELSKATRNIQPGYRNGGSSLADIAARLDRIEAHFG